MTKLSLLSNSTDNPKIEKSIGYYWYPSILHLSPADTSGKEVCPGRSLGCTSVCLHTAGNPAFMASKIAGRLRKTKMWFEDRPLFKSLLLKDVDALVKKHTKVCVRLNGTSDIRWEKDFPELFETHPDVQFYDYTKIPVRKTPKNYHLTFSRSESNDKWLTKAWDSGMNIAVVFDRGGVTSWNLGFGDIPCIDGDEHDLRFLDEPHRIVALKAKGSARKDTSGFVIQTGSKST